MAITGFATTFEVLQTYIPASDPSGVNRVGFRVPYMPEGMAGVDWFDTHWGRLDTVGDWSQAQSLQCEYPATPPEVGDYLTVEDTLPTPAPGAGYWYLTAVHFMGETRVGRKASNGALTGRDPSVLPDCGLRASAN